MNTGPANTSIFKQLLTGFSRAIGSLFTQDEDPDEAPLPGNPVLAEEADYSDLPNELLVPLFKSVIKDQPLFGTLRLCNRTFLSACDRALADQYGIKDDEDFEIAFQKQQDEIDYLLQHKYIIIGKGLLDLLISTPSIKQACFKKLEEIRKVRSMIAFHARELAIERLNAVIFREKVKELKKHTFHEPGLNYVSCKEAGLTRLCIYPDPKFLNELTKIDVLDLTANRLTYLSPEIKHFTALKVLWANGNQLRHLPAELVEIPTLEVLSLEGNQLRSLPEDFERLRNLKKISLVGNKLKTFPMKIGDFPRLLELYLEKNQLQTLPDAMPDNILWRDFRFENGVLQDRTQLTKAQVLERQHPQETELVVKRRRRL